uniref:Uncharacterized protein n=1 Tax=Anguilla anguilla TaxID=7936 RepID=A0A0E9QEZ9_ANGAN
MCSLSPLVPEFVCHR